MFLFTNGFDKKSLPTIKGKEKYKNKIKYMKIIVNIIIKSHGVKIKKKKLCT